MTLYQDLLAGPPLPPPSLLPEDSATADLDAGVDLRQVAADHPDSSLVWALLADEAWGEGRVVESYAFARTGYHRGLDALRRSGWKGRGPVPWEHDANRGFLRALNALGRAAGEIDEDDEADRCEQLLADSSAAAVFELNREQS